MRLYNREGIPIRDALTPKEYRQILRNVRWHPKEWYLRLRSPQVPGIMVSADKIIVFIRYQLVYINSLPSESAGISSSGIGISNYQTCFGRQSGGPAEDWLLWGQHGRLQEFSPTFPARPSEFLSVFIMASNQPLTLFYHLSYNSQECTFKVDTFQTIAYQ